MDSSKKQPENSSNKALTSAERLYHVDDTPGGSVLSARARASATGSNGSDAIQPTNDPICCITARDKVLMVARESGLVQRYAMPNVALTNKYHINTKAHKLALNCNST